MERQSDLASISTANLLVASFPLHSVPRLITLASTFASTRRCVLLPAFTLLST